MMVSSFSLPSARVSRSVTTRAVPTRVIVHKKVDMGEKVVLVGESTSLGESFTPVRI